MRPTPNLAVEASRVRHGPMASSRFDGNNGQFLLWGPGGPNGPRLLTQVSDEDGWEHVSVSVPALANQMARTPTWDEMSFVKDLFWEPEECVVQYHPPRSQYRNLHTHCLHLWRPTDGITFPMPDPDMVAPSPPSAAREVRPWPPAPLTD